MRPAALALDLAVALAVAACVLILSPGVAVDGIIAVVALLLCGAGYGLEAWLKRLHRSRAQRRITARRSRSS